LKEAALFAAGAMGFQIDFGLKVIEKTNTCWDTFKSKFIDLTI
jgi:hypothetical protein